MVELRIENTIDKIQNLLCATAKGVVTVSCYGYGCNSDRSLVAELISDKNDLEAELIDLRLGKEECLTQSELNSFIGKINKKLVTCGTNCPSLQVDSENYDTWVAANPYCRVYESWETCENTIAPEYGVFFETVNLQPYFQLGLNFTDITPQIILKLETLKLDQNLTLGLESSVDNLETILDVTSTEKIDKLRLDIELCRLNHDLLLFSKKLIKNFNLDISSVISKKALDLEILINSFNFDAHLEVYMSKSELSSDLEIYIEKLKWILDVPVLSNLLEKQKITLDDIKAIYDSGCILNLNPISLENKRGVFDINLSSRKK